MSTITFTLASIAYVLFSLFIYGLASFTSAAWIVYLFILVPFYLICVLWVAIKLAAKSKQMIRYRAWLLLPIITSQFFVILSSPASCYGWHQGVDCYCFVQKYFESKPDSADLSSFVPANSLHWQFENVFPFAVLMYMISIIAFLNNVRAKDATSIIEN